MSVHSYLRSKDHRSTSSDNEIRLNCIECNDGKYHLYANAVTGRWICHRCGAKGGIRALVSAIEDVHSFADVKRILDRMNAPTVVPDGLSKLDILSEIRSKNKNNPVTHKPIAMPSWARRLASSSLLAKRYLRGRGFSTADMNYYQIRVDNDDRTVIVPFYEDGDLVYYQVRSIQGNTKLNPPKGEALGKSCYVFNYDGAKRHDRIVIVEGWADAITVGRNAVSIQGKVLSKMQAEKLCGIGKEYVVFLDNDDDTARHQESVARLLTKTTGKPVYMVSAYGKVDKDPNALGRTVCKQLLETSVVRCDYASIAKMMLRTT